MYVIRNWLTERFLSGVSVGTGNVINQANTITWSVFVENALHFSEKEEAQATVQFIGDVIDWELTDYLEIVVSDE